MPTPEEIAKWSEYPTIQYTPDEQSRREAYYASPEFASKQQNFEASQLPEYPIDAQINRQIYGSNWQPGIDPMTGRPFTKPKEPQLSGLFASPPSQQNANQPSGAPNMFNMYPIPKGEPNPAARTISEALWKASGGSEDVAPQFPWSPKDGLSYNERMRQAGISVADRQSTAPKTQQKPPTATAIQQPPTGLTFPEYTKQTSAPDIGVYRQALRGLTSGEPTAADMELAGRLRASAATSAATSAPPVDEQMLVNGVRFTPAGRAGTTQVGGRSIMGDYVDTVRSGLLAQDATAKAQQLGNTPEGRAYAEMARAHDEAYQSAKQAFASKYGPNANNIFQQASQQLRSRGITPEQLMSGAADRMTENVVFPQYGEVLPGMGVATNAQGQIVRTVTGAPSGAPQTVYTPTAQGIQATSLVPRQTLMDPGLAAYLGASQITPEAARLSAEGLPVMQSSLTKRERLAQQVAKADLTKALSAARKQLGLSGGVSFAPPALEADGFTKKSLSEGSTLLSENAQLSKLRAETEDPQLRAQYEAQMAVNNAQLYQRGFRPDPKTGIWGLPSAGGTPKGLGASPEQLKPGAVGSKGFVNMGKQQADFVSRYSAAMQKAPETAPELGSEADVGRKAELDNLRKEGARLGILFDSKGAPRAMTEADLSGPVTPDAEPTPEQMAEYQAFYGPDKAKIKQAMRARKFKVISSS